MNQEEHLSTARDLMTRASQESQDGGNDVIAAEFLWGAFAHCLIVVAQNEGLPQNLYGAQEPRPLRPPSLQARIHQPDPPSS